MCTALAILCITEPHYILCYNQYWSTYMCKFQIYQITSHSVSLLTFADFNQIIGFF